MLWRYETEYDWEKLRAFFVGRDSDERFSCFVMRTSADFDGEAVKSTFVPSLDWPSIQLTLDGGLAGLSILKEIYDIRMSLDLE